VVDVEKHHSALVGILVKDGKLKVDDPAPIRAMEKDERSRITLSDLLRQAAGWPGKKIMRARAERANMLFTKRHGALCCIVAG